MPEPTIELDQTKEHLRVEHDLDDSLISAYISAAISSALASIGLSDVLDVDQTLDFAGQSVCMPLPLHTVTSVVVLNSDGTEGDSLTSDDWTATETTLTIDTDPAPGEQYRMVYVAGWATTPSWFNLACLFLIAHFYENRSASVIGPGIVVADLPMGVEHLLAPHRRIWFS